MNGIAQTNHKDSLTWDGNQMEALTFAHRYKLITTHALAICLAGVSLCSYGQTLENDPQDLSPQEFTLFGEVAVSTDNTSQDDRSSARRRRASARDNAGPEFTLVGTTRIGDRYSAILKNRDGNEVRVSTEQGRNTRIEGYSGFSVVDVGPGRVSVQYPGSNACIEFQDQGVSCNAAANIASLELTMGEPVPRAVITPAEESVEQDAEVVVSEDESEAPTNPFAQLRARALENGSLPPPTDTPRRAFTPRRIDPADVPPGMRIVSTPFGDRLVRE